MPRLSRPVTKRILRQKRNGTSNEVPFLFCSYSSSLRLSAMVLANSDALLGGV